MKDLKGKKRNRWNKKIVIPCFVFLILLVCIIYSLIYIEDLSVMQNVDLLRQSVKRAIVQCYAIEGSYPPDIAYLEEHYGLVIDNDKYYVEYDALAANLMPNFDIFEKY